jgi:aryl-alcohol dehydrogenase-like predicted oxidoreductase
MYAVPSRPETQGKTEEYIGTWIKNRGKRDDIILATKIAGPAGSYTAHIRPDNDYSPRTIAEAVDNSLKRLQTDYIDLYQIHWPARPANFFGKRGYVHDEKWQNNIRAILEGLQQQILAGKIRHVGISNETPWGFMEYLREAERNDLPKIVSVQNPYNLLNRLYEVGMAEISIRENAGLLAYSPMAFGLLSGKYHRGMDKSEDRINQFQGLSRYNSSQCKEATARYIAIAEKYELTPAIMSLAWVNQQEFVTANIIGATSLIQLKENISSIDVTLSKECVKEINEVHESIPNPAP